MQRLMSYDPRVAWPPTLAGETTLKCHKFHASRIQAREKLRGKLEQLRSVFEVTCGRREVMEDSLEGRIMMMINDLDDLSSRDVSLADQFGKIGDEADKTRQQFQRYQTWSGGLSPSIEEDTSTVTDSSLDDLRASPVSIPKTADATGNSSPRFPEYGGSFDQRARGSPRFPGFLLPPAIVFPKYKGSGHPFESASPRDTGIAANQTTARGPINLLGTHSIFDSDGEEGGGLKDGEEHSAVNAAEDEIVNMENKIRGVEIRISDYDNKPSNDPKSDVKFESARNSPAAVEHDLRQTSHLAPQEISREKVGDRTAGIKSHGKVNDSVRCTGPQIRSDKSRGATSRGTNSPLATNTNPSFPMRGPSEVKKHAVETGRAALLRTKERSQPPQVPVKKLNLSMVKTTTRKEQV